MTVRDNRVKQVLAEGGRVFSSAVRLPAPGLCEILGYAGFDFVLIDGEHGGVDASAVDGMVQSCWAGGTQAFYRVLHNDDEATIMKVLDLGVQGVLIPHCRNAGDAHFLQQAALYPPAGRRGFGPGRGTRWGRVTTEDYFRTVNDSVFLFALVEDPEGVENIGEIAAAGLDGLWVGTGDLALSYGVPGQRRHPKVLEAAGRILDACRERDIACGFPAGDVEEAHWAIEQGYRLVGFGGAESFVMRGARQVLEAVGR
ncbi:MAG: HpcH/HpaI aldolase/citrate lyase family protein [Planctomycetaceae bacterium]